MVSSLRGLVSDETLLAQIPFIDDVSAELNRVDAQTEREMSQYRMPNLIEADADEAEER